jgi:hypothetical protein
MSAELKCFNSKNQQQQTITDKSGEQRRKAGEQPLQLLCSGSVSDAGSARAVQIKKCDLAGDAPSSPSHREPLFSRFSPLFSAFICDGLLQLPAPAKTPPKCTMFVKR